jgi:hypothetical protein
MANAKKSATIYCKGCWKVLAFYNKSGLCHRCWQMVFDRKHRGVGR